MQCVEDDMRRVKLCGVVCTGPCRLENWDQGEPSNPGKHGKTDVKNDNDDK